MHARDLIRELAHFPWVPTALTLRERFREDRLGLTASSLTFTTTIALVPFFTVALAVFTAFPMFSQVQASLEAWLVQSVIPDAIARQVIGYLTQFASKASRMGALGLAVLFVSALALVLTIDRTLNNIWRVRRPRPLTQRVLIYWAVMTLGPLMVGASLTITSYAVSASRGLVAALPGGASLVLDAFELFVLAAGFAALYRWVPNTPVRRSHAWAGGVFAAAGLALARKGLAIYVGTMPTYSMVYGAFATVPILLIWIYIGWVVVLLGAVIAAYLPSLLAGTRRRARGPGWRFELALDVLQRLAALRATPARGASMAALSAAMQVDMLQLEPPLEALVELDWVGRLNEADDEDRTRYVLLADPATTSLEPLVRRLLLPDATVTSRVWTAGSLSQARLADVL